MPAAKSLRSAFGDNIKKGEMRRPVLLNNFIRTENSEDSSALNRQTFKHTNNRSLKDKIKDNDTVPKLPLSGKQNARQNVSLKRIKSLASCSSINTPRSGSSMGDSTLHNAKSLDSDEECFNSDIEDEDTPRLQTQTQDYWSSFEDSIKKIHDQTESLTLKARPNFKSSDAYKEVMVDMYGNTEYGRARSYTLLKEKINKMATITGLTSRLLAGISKKPDPEVIKDDADDDKKGIDEKKDMESELKGAKRGWKLLKRHVQETALEEKTKDANVKWNMIRHHVSRMSDMERARRDLYERYGIVPVLQDDGTMQCKNVMWSKRAISLNQTSPVCYNIPSNSAKNSRKSKRSRNVRPATSIGARQHKPVFVQKSSGRPSSEKVKLKSAFP